jgi:hypothetical protein
MSSVVLSGDTSGTVTLTVPAIAGSNTVTVPAGTGTVAVQGVSTNIVSGTAVASTSGTSIDFTSIPSWVKRITVMLNNVSTNSTSALLIQLGTSGGIENSGYAGANSYGGSGATTWYSTGFNVFQTQYAASLHSGSVVLTTLGSNIWTQTGVIAQNVTGTPFYSAGAKTMTGGVVTTVRITTVNGTDTFDAGSINILYE